MARSIIADLLTVYPFWLCDVSPIEPLALPVLTPLFGFSAISAPEITVDIREITEGNWYFKKKVIKGADISTITMERGATFYDSDFWKWIFGSLNGDLNIFSDSGGLSLSSLLTTPGISNPRRVFILVQFLSRMPFKLPAGTDGIVAAASQATIATAGSALAGGQLDVASGLKAVGFAAINALGLGPFEFAARLPAKAWMLYGCLPSRYKVGGDFDASSSAISIQQCDIVVEGIEEISLTS